MEAAAGGSRERLAIRCEDDVGRHLGDGQAGRRRVRGLGSIRGRGPGADRGGPALEAGTIDRDREGSGRGFVTLPYPARTQVRTRRALGSPPGTDLGTLDKVREAVVFASDLGPARSRRHVGGRGPRQRKPGRPGGQSREGSVPKPYPGPYPEGVSTPSGTGLSP